MKTHAYHLCDPGPLLLAPFVNELGIVQAMESYGPARLRGKGADAILPCSISSVSWRVIVVSIIWATTEIALLPWPVVWDVWKPFKIL